METWVALSIVVVVVVLASAWTVLRWVWVRPKTLERCLREQGLTGNSYRLLFGYLKESSKMTSQAMSTPINFTNDIAPSVVPFFHQNVNNYGKNSFMWVGPTPRVNIMNPEQLKDVFSNISDFRKIEGTPFAKLLATGILQYDAEKWAKHRKIINLAFHLEKLKNMLPAFRQSCSDMISKWESMVSEEGSIELDVWPYLQNLSSDMISRTAFGSSYEEGRNIFELQRELAEPVIQTTRSIYIPGWRFLPTKKNKRMKEIRMEIQASLKGITNKRERAIKQGEGKNDDFLGILVESNLKDIEEHGNNMNMGMNLKDVIKECKLFYFAGQETSSVLLVWTMVMLTRHPSWQQRAREEVLEVFGQNKPDFDGLNRLKVFFESTILAREFAKIASPQSMSQIALPIILVHHDHELWGDDAHEFKPLRFSEGVSKATKGQVSFFPFGWGPQKYASDKTLL
ncbi:hypothetical protein FH972_019481 [Carpinus fangiana]|uniref:Cytochrome P450 n=1 Tax=Carpinus fangiana TaxID=176857 RepID=A0A5N6RUM8_9ROSI|nr:hypothetical protein FH972_019481 [Carpinus fangiana]